MSEAPSSVYALLTDSAKVYDAKHKRFETWKLYKTDSAAKHPVSDDESIKASLIKALNAGPGASADQGDDTYRFKINDGKGYIAFKIGVLGANTAAVFHYHVNYNLDGHQSESQKSKVVGGRW